MIARSAPSAMRAAAALLGALLAALAPAARGQVSAASPADELRGPGHGWVVLPADDEGFTLWHVPPRLSSAQVEGAPSGTLRIVQRLHARPEQVAAWGGDVWLVAPASRPRDEGEPLRLVHRLSMAPSPLGSGWHYLEGGRLRAERPLPGPDRLLATAGSAGGLCVLTRTPGAAPRLRRLGRDGWGDLALPPEAAGAGEAASLGLIALAEGVGLWLQEGERLVWWTGVTAGPAPLLGVSPPAPEEIEAPDDAAAAAAEPLPMEWTLRPLAGALNISREGRLWSIGGRIIATEWTGATTLRVRDLSGERPVTLAETDGVDPAAAACALDGSRRVAIVWRDPEAGGGAPRPPWNPRRIVEISTDDGSVMFDGMAESPGPVSPAEFRLLALALVVISAGALVFIVRSDDGRRPIALPDGSALAPARLRVVAGVIDGIIAWIMAGWLLSPELGAAALRESWLSVDVGGQTLDFVPLLMTLAVGWAMGSLCEWLTGRSVGKWMTGCAVVSVRPGDHRPGLMRAPRLWQALVRNFVKYPLAPVAMLGLASPDLRHRGDALSWTAVIVPVGEAPGPGGESE